MLSGDSQWVAVGDGGRVLTSPDGTTWSLGTSNTPQNLQGITRGSTVFVAVGDSGTVITSVDGVSWTAQSISGTNLNAVTAGAQFVAVGDNGVIFTSVDGTTWLPQSSGTSSNLYAVTRRGSGYSAVGAAGTNLIAN